MQALNVKAKSLKHLWIYHYAGVVAKDGGDTITLENYNRGREKKWNISEAFNDLFVAQAAFRDFVWNTTATLKAQDFIQQLNLIDQAQARGAVVNGALQVVLDAAQAKVHAGIGPTHDMYHFKMYGGQAGQSFHETWQSSMANQVTLRVRQSLNELKQTKLAASDGIRMNMVAAFTKVCPDPNISGRLVAFRILVDAQLQQSEHDITNALTIHDVKQAVTAFNHRKDDARVEIAQCLAILTPGVAAAADLPALIVQLQVAVNAHAVGWRVRGRRAAINLRNSFAALLGSATDVQGAGHL